MQLKKMSCFEGTRFNMFSRFTRRLSAGYCKPAKSASLKTAIDMGLIESLNKSNHRITARELATNTACDEPLVGTKAVVFPRLGIRR